MNNDHEVARYCAELAARRLREVRGGGTSDKDRGVRGDGAAQHVLADALARLRPDDAVLSEESPDDPARLTADRVWIVDPLDGTREFAEPPREDWAVHVALWERGELTAGAVALPAIGVTLSTLSTPSTSDTIGRVGGPERGRARLVVSRSRAPEFVAGLAEAIDAQVVPMGSAGAKAAAVIRGEADIYVHGGGQYEWDSAAPVVVARRFGLHTSRVDGSVLRYNQPDPYLPDLLVCRADLAHPVLDYLAASR